MRIALVMTLPLVVIALAGCADTEYRLVSYEQMYYDQHEVSQDEERTHVVAPALVDHLGHEEWTTMVMSCSKHGCIPIFIHHERDDWRVCDRSGGGCFQFSTGQWDHPVVEGEGYVTGVITWNDCEFWWWSTCDEPHHETKTRDVAFNAPPGAVEAPLGVMR